MGMPSSGSRDNAARETLAKLQSLIAKKEYEVAAMRVEVKAKEEDLKEAMGRLDELTEELIELREVCSAIGLQTGTGAFEQGSSPEPLRAALSTENAASDPQMGEDVREHASNGESLGAGPSTDHAANDPEMGKARSEQGSSPKPPDAALRTDSAPSRSPWQATSASDRLALGPLGGERGGARSHLEDDSGDDDLIPPDDPGKETPKRNGGDESRERLDMEGDGWAQGHAQGTHAGARTFILPGIVDNPSSGDEEHEHEAHPMFTDAGLGIPTSTRASRAEAESLQAFVSNIDFSVGEDQLQRLFCTCGDVMRAKLLTDRETGKSRGKAFVTFAANEGVEEALKLEGQVHWGRKLYVSRVGDAYKDKSRQCFLDRMAERQRKHQEYLERKASSEQKYKEYIERQARRESKQQEFEARQQARVEREMARSQRQQEAIWRKHDAGMYHKVWVKG